MNKQMQETVEKMKSNMAKIKHKIVVMSGKGGVGKSTISTNIAYGLSLEGKKVGLLDADLHGPNIPLMLGVEGQKMNGSAEPIQIHENLKVLSLSFFSANSDEPVIWRGPAKIGVLRQMIGDINWGELDYLVVDLPPGTGDEPLTIAQDLGQIDGSVIVTTPQNVALLDSRKSVKFSKMVHMPILGIVENMSGFVCPHCNERIDIFKKGGGEKAAKELGVNFLGKVPMTPEIVDAGDDGKPYIYFNKGGIAVDALKGIVNNLLAKIEGDEEVMEAQTKGDEEVKTKGMKIAFPTNDELHVEEHFGHCKKFAIVNVVDDKITSKEMLAAPAHQPGLLPKFLGEQGATAIITGGMGQAAINLFKEQNIEVILGATGKIEENLQEYLGGVLASTGSACNHDHDDHDHNCAH